MKAPDGPAPDFYRGFAEGLADAVDAFEVVHKALERGAPKEVARSLSVCRNGLKRYARSASMTPHEQAINAMSEVLQFKHAKEFCDGYRQAVAAALQGLDGLDACASDGPLLCQMARMFGDMLTKWAQPSDDEELKT